MLDCPVEVVVFSVLTSIKLALSASLLRKFNLLAALLLNKLTGAVLQSQEVCCLSSLFGDTKSKSGFWRLLIMA